MLARPSPHESRWFVEKKAHLILHVREALPARSARQVKPELDRLYRLMLRNEIHRVQRPVVVLEALIDCADLGRQIAIGDGDDEVAAYSGLGRILAENATGC